MPTSSAPRAGRDEPPAIDVDHLDAQSMGDAALAGELLDLFARQAVRILGEIAAAPGPSAAARARRAGLLHTLCGSARAVGAWRVADEAERLERDARELSSDVRLDGFQALARSVEQARAVIAAMGVTA